MVIHQNGITELESWFTWSYELVGVTFIYLSSYFMFVDFTDCNCQMGYCVVGEYWPIIESFSE